MTKKNNIKKILFVDFNGVISYDSYWKELQNPNHKLHDFKSSIENFLFKQSRDIIKDWMIGKYTSEEIHNTLEKEVGVPASELFPIFQHGCEQIDLSKEILSKIKSLKNKFYCILSTGNMDCFNRFTLTSNPILTESFDEINNSYDLGVLKTTNNGQYFMDKANELKVDINNCVVIDDSKKVCRTFEKLGGTGHCKYGVEEVLKCLREISYS